MTPYKLVRQMTLTGDQIDKDKRIINIQPVKVDEDGDLVAANFQEHFVMEFTDDIGKGTAAAKSAGDAPTKAEFDALVDKHNKLLAEFNELVATAEKCGILHHLSTNSK